MVEANYNKKANETNNPNEKMEQVTENEKTYISKTLALGRTPHGKRVVSKEKSLKTFFWGGEWHYKGVF